jgi:hypothetical protein
MLRWASAGTKEPDGSVVPRTLGRHCKSQGCFDVDGFGSTEIPVRTVWVAWWIPHSPGHQVTERTPSHLERNRRLWSLGFDSQPIPLPSTTSKMATRCQARVKPSRPAVSLEYPLADLARRTTIAPSHTAMF